MNNRNFFKRILIGVKKGWSTPTLPEHIIQFTRNPLVQIFRTLGTLCIVLIISNKLSILGNGWLYFIVLNTCTLIIFLFIIYHLTILFYKIRHIIKVIKSDDLNIRNSSLDRLASIAGKIILSNKGVCYTIISITILTSGCLSIDEIIKSVGSTPLFSPIFISILQQGSLSLKDLVTVKTDMSVTSNLITDNSDIKNNGFLLLLVNRISKYIPLWVKLAFSLMLFILFVFKWIGFENVFNTLILGDLIYLKLFTVILCLLAILFNLLNIYLIYKFSKSNIKISEVLPNFLISWLNDFKVICETEDSIKDYKGMYYKEIFLYISVIILITFLL